MRLAHLGVLAASFSALALARGDGHGPKTARTSAMADNPFMQPSTLPFELPPFDRIRDSDYLPAFQAGMREQLTEVARIAHNPQPAAFDNTASTRCSSCPARPSDGSMPATPIRGCRRSTPRW